MIKDLFGNVDVLGKIKCEPNPGTPYGVNKEITKWMVSRRDELLSTVRVLALAGETVDLSDIRVGGACLFGPDSYRSVENVFLRKDGAMLVMEINYYHVVNAKVVKTTKSYTYDMSCYGGKTMVKFGDVRGLLVEIPIDCAITLLIDLREMVLEARPFNSYELMRAMLLQELFARRHACDVFCKNNVSDEDLSKKLLKAKKSFDLAAYIRETLGGIKMPIYFIDDGYEIGDDEWGLFITEGANRSYYYEQSVGANRLRFMLKPKGKAARDVFVSQYRSGTIRCKLMSVDESGVVATMLCNVSVATLTTLADQVLKFMYEEQGEGEH